MGTYILKNFAKLVSQALKEVNILTLKYKGVLTDLHGTVPLEVDNLYAGKIPPIQGDTDFNKLLQAASIPPKNILVAKLLAKRPRTFITPKQR